MKNLELHSDRFSALSHPLRLGILRHIVQGDPAGTPAGEIQKALEVPASTLSHHLASLTAAGLVRVQREGTLLRHRADFETLQALTDFLWEDCCGRGSSASCAPQACCPAPEQAASPPPAAPLPPAIPDSPLPRRRPRNWAPYLD
ncbi:MAG: helix-turn-helix transcriptional regulator [Acidobacteria bacterium]|nr:helix-turn-helix transcriptional regulator [Acidobacteriota bacterium]